jgi:hypothetical protein
MRRPWRREREDDPERELRSDPELEAVERRERGLSPEQARYAARRAFGNTASLKEEVRKTWGWTWIGFWPQAPRFGSLAPGLGAAALFSPLNALLFKTLPVPKPERLIVLRHGTGASLDEAFTYPGFAMPRDQAKDAAIRRPARRHC